jgi:class 3 adenylate cyclase
MIERPLSRLHRTFFSLKFSLGGAFFAIVALTSLLLGSILYVNMHAFILNDLRARLRSAVGVAALQIDVAEHERIRSRADESAPAYLKIRRQLREIRARITDVHYIYTMRRDPDGTFRFVVDAEEKPEDVSHVGEPYPAPTDAMKKVLTPPYAAHVEPAFTTDKWGAYISGFAPLLDARGEAVGLVGVDVSAADHARFENRFVYLMLGAFGGISLVVLIVSVFFTRRITRPLTDLALEMGRIQRFDLDGEVRVESNIREIVQMRTALENMKKGLRSFKRYVPADLVSQLIQLRREAALGAEKKTVTVLFSDIAGFTTISESMPPEKLAESLAVYFEGMTRAILEEGGTVDKFVGDAIMAFWGAPRDAEDHAARACRAALRCQAFLEARFGKERRAGEPDFATRIGINTGEAYVGNFGFSERMSYTAIGDPVNLASRIEGMNKSYGTRLMISESTLAAAGTGFAARRVDRVAVKGKSRGVWVHELAGETARLAPAAADFLKRFDAAVALYQENRWADAAAAFAALAAAAPADGPSRLLLARCREFAAAPPAGWDGVFHLHEK